MLFILISMKKVHVHVKDKHTAMHAVQSVR